MAPECDKSVHEAGCDDLAEMLEYSLGHVHGGVCIDDIGLWPRDSDDDFLGPRPDPHEVALARRYIWRHCRKAGGIVSRTNRWGVNQIRRATGQQISSGAFIEAAVREGYALERVNPGSAYVRMDMVLMRAEVEPFERFVASLRNSAGRTGEVAISGSVRTEDDALREAESTNDPLEAAALRRIVELWQQRLAEDVASALAGEFAGSADDEAENPF